ncbi:MAG: hypothetical protein MZU97_12260 [Bacillus subtilis]|nr:hypothetical protein [Bacillus subtilis]
MRVSGPAVPSSSLAEMLRAKARRFPRAVTASGLPEIPYASRSLPLPFTGAYPWSGGGSDSMPGDFAVPPPSPLKPETRKAVSRLLRNARELPRHLPDSPSFPRISEASAAGGGKYTLRTIVRDRLAKQDWKGASDELARYLSLNREPRRRRPGPLLPGTGPGLCGPVSRGRSSEFLLAQDRYYRESNVWIDWLLDRMPSAAQTR